jgi:hypothetical protein
VEQTQELLQKWDDRARRLYPRMEISREGLTIGAGTMLAGMARDARGRPRLTLDDEPRALALLATAYDRPVEACVVAKLQRACERWTEGGTALAHIYLAHTGLPPCGPDQALRLRQLRRLHVMPYDRKELLANMKYKLKLAGARSA